MGGGGTTNFYIMLAVSLIFAELVCLEAILLPRCGRPHRCQVQVWTLWSHHTGPVDKQSSTHTQMQLRRRHGSPVADTMDPEHMEQYAELS